MTFEELWKNYPKKKSEYQHDAKEISDYCAIKVSISLIKSKIQLKGSFKGAFCWGCKDGGIHAIRAQELANWLKNVHLRDALKLKFLQERSLEKMNERTGIVFLRTIGKEILILVKIVQEIILIYGMVEDLIN